MYAHDRGGIDKPPDKCYPGVFHLARVPREHSNIIDRSSYEFFAGTDNKGNPKWTGDIGQRAAVFFDSNGAGLPSVSYNPGVERYLLTTGHGCGAGDSIRKLGIFDAPEPWGPWTTVDYYDDWGGYTGYRLGYYIPTKTPDWMSVDGKTIHLVFSGDNELDSFNLAKATLTLNTQATQTPSSTPIPTSTPLPTTPPPVTPPMDSLQVFDVVNAADWNIFDNLSLGDPPYGDRNFTFTTIPTYLAGQWWLQTANDSKTYTSSPIAQLTLTQAATVYVGLDVRISPPPIWLQDWTPVAGPENQLVTSSDALNLYQKSFPAGTVSLGPNTDTGSGSTSMYSVVVVPSSTLQGDINTDGVVNILDYTLLSNAFGTSDADADINSDSIVNILDYTILSINFGKTSG